MTDRNDLTDALQKLSEDPGGEPATAPSKPTPMPSRPQSTPPPRPRRHRAGRRGPTRSRPTPLQ